MIIETIDRDSGRLEWRDDEHAPRYGRRADGYGRKIPTHRRARLDGKGPWRRLYVCQFSNAGTAYLAIGKDWLVVT